MMLHTCNPNTRKAEAAGSPQVRGQPELCMGLCVVTKNKTKGDTSAVVARNLPLNTVISFFKNVFAVLGIEAKASRMLGECGLTELHPQLSIAAPQLWKLVT